MKIEYKVRPVTRYVVTRFEGRSEDDQGGGYVGSSVCGEFPSGYAAYQIAYALAHAESERLGLAPGDETVMYPEMPEGANVETNAIY